MTAPYITAEQTAAFFEARGYAAENADCDSRCSDCTTPTDPSELTRLDGEDACLPCARLALGYELDWVDSWRDL